MSIDKVRCDWCQNNSLNLSYHDREWGVPIYDDRLLFEFLILEGMQAGLSWVTILKKRDEFRKAFLNFNPEKIKEFDQDTITNLLNNTGIIRNKLKINSAVENAKSFLKIKKECGSFSNYIWAFVDNHPIQNHWDHAKQIPVKTSISESMSNDLKKRGFKFVGSTICYSYMQAVGMVNDHTVRCFRHQEIEEQEFAINSRKN